MREDVLYRPVISGVRGELHPALRAFVAIVVVVMALLVLVVWGVYGPKPPPKPACSGSVVIRQIDQPLTCTPESFQIVKLAGMNQPECHSALGVYDWRDHTCQTPNR